MRKAINSTIATQLWNDGLTDKEIGEKMGFTENGIRQWRMRNDLPSNNGIFSWDELGYVDTDKTEYRKYA